MLEQLFSFLVNTLEGTDKAKTSYILVGYLPEIARFIDSKTPFQLFWCVDEKDAYLTDNGKKAALWVNNSVRHKATYIIAFDGSLFLTREA